MSADSILNHELQPYIRYADLLHFQQWKTPPRIITDYMLLYVQEGSFRLQAEGALYEVNQGQFIFVQPGIVHQMESEAPVCLMSLHMELFPSQVDARPEMIVPIDHAFNPETVPLQPSLKTFADISIPYLLKLSRHEWMLDTLQQAIAHWGRKNAIDLLQAQVHATEIVLELLKEYTTRDTSEHSRSTSLSWVPAYMQYRLSEPLTVEEMAHKALMSRSYFSLHFRSQFGVSPHQFLLKLRLDYATDLLRGTDFPLQDIADSCGFSSVHHFSKMYKLRFGYPPSQIRRHP
ncbi:AraC family transcriptional regulator [Paenibacillus anseongense]|uniref:AraC family transcriptional regulator n=1 Tax=Paenibacillus anseongense TaxID=2682845 RepID=UPI002DB9F08C|nr:helix-turn-helix domain-containing protein [Paenibacillus anseongense]MEC0266320.1 helix-turn-helix domain-containing protein [Paenibacillus anseongense]